MYKISLRSFLLVFSLSAYVCSYVQAQSIGSEDINLRRQAILDSLAKPTDVTVRKKVILDSLAKYKAASQESSTSAHAIPLPKELNKAIRLDFYPQAGVAFTDVYMRMEATGGGNGYISTRGAGPFVSLTLGNTYSPIPEGRTSKLTWGLVLQYSTTFGSGSTQFVSYTPYMSVESSRYESEPRFKFQAETTVASAVISGGISSRLSRDVVWGVQIGFGLGLCTSRATWGYTDFFGKEVKYDYTGVFTGFIRDLELSVLVRDRLVFNTGATYIVPPIILTPYSDSRVLGLRIGVGYRLPLLGK